VLPTLVREAGAPHARWRPVVRGLDAVAVEALVAALPYECAIRAGRVYNTGGK